MNGSDLIPVFNQYVGFGDMIAANEVTSMLARKSHAVRVRPASNIEFADMRSVQTLLIGAVTNRWTMATRRRFPTWSPPTSGNAGFHVRHFISHRRYSGKLCS